MPGGLPFLSSVLFAIVLLYGYTKGRWRWRKIVVWTLVVSVILIAGTAAVVALNVYWSELFPERLGRQAEYAGLKLGMSPQEVMYIKGYPPIVLEKDADPNSEWKDFLLVKETKDLAKGKKVTDYKHWSYKQFKSTLGVEFDDNRTAVVAITCMSGERLRSCQPIGSVQDGTSEQDALRKLGGPAEQRIDGVTKDLRFPRLGVQLTLEKQEVYMLRIYAPQSNYLMLRVTQRQSSVPA